MSDGCRVCGSQDEQLHRTKEQDGILNHQWSTTGELIRVAKTPPSRARQTPILVVGGIDTGLRKLLLDKGILTHEDFASLLSSGPGTEGDRGDRETPTPE